MMIVTGSMMLGFILPEIFTITGKVKVPILINILCALGIGLIISGLLH